jgi:hypothetical protein
MCVRDDALPRIASGAPGLRQVTVYSTGNVGAAPRAGDPETDRAHRFWTEAEMVPLEEAAWFTDLVTRGKDALRS